MRIDRITRTDIARRAQVSKATVSYVINDKAEEKRISRATIERVLEAMAALDYTPSHHGQALRQGATRCIGVLPPPIGRLGDDSRLAVISASVQAQERGWYACLMASAKEAREALESGRVDALVVACDRGCPRGLKSARRVVGVGAHTPKEWSAVWSDPRRACEAACASLLTRHQAALLCADDQGHWQRAAAAVGLAVQELDPSRPESLQDTGLVLAGSERAACAIMQGVVSAGLHIPDDVAVCAIGSELGATIHPALSCVDLQTADVWATAMDLAIELFESDGDYHLRQAVEGEVRWRATCHLSDRSTGLSW